MAYWHEKIFEILNNFKFDSNNNINVSLNNSKATRIDDLDPNNIYLGYAPAGNSESATNWKIEKITNTPYAIYQATGAWDNRYNLTYL